MIDQQAEAPRIDTARCLGCAKCIQICPTGTLTNGEKGYRVQIGGKLGHHPKLARELPGIFNQEQVLEIVKACLWFYKQNSRQGERFGELFQDQDFEELAKRFGE